MKRLGVFSKIELPAQVREDLFVKVDRSMDITKRFEATD